MAGRITQAFLESIDLANAEGRVTQVFFETTDLNVPPTQGRATQVFVEYTDLAPVAGAGGSSSSMLTFVGP